MSTFYRVNQAVARGLGHLLSPGSATILGRELVPATGPFILVANHESFLDPILIQAFCPRPLHAMAKSTQFAAPVLGAWMRRLHAYPVRRFQVDAQAVRVTLRRLAEGHGVAIYVEGERSWDGRLLEPRRGALRLILKAGVPVVPCAIHGVYEVLPRWASGLRRHPVRIAFGPPIAFPRSDSRAQRDRLLAELSRRLKDELRGLGIGG